MNIGNNGQALRAVAGALVVEREALWRADQTGGRCRVQLTFDTTAATGRPADGRWLGAGWVVLVLACLCAVAALRF